MEVNCLHRGLWTSLKNLPGALCCNGLQCPLSVKGIRGLTHKLVAKAVFKLICGFFERLHCFRTTHLTVGSAESILVLFCAHLSVFIEVYSFNSAMSLEETVFQCPVHSKLDQAVPHMCAPWMGKEGRAMCFHLQSLLQTFFTPWGISVCCCSWKNKRLSTSGPGSWGSIWKLWFYNLSFLLVAWDEILGSVTMGLTAVSTPDWAQFVLIREDEIFLSSELANN